MRGKRTEKSFKNEKPKAGNQNTSYSKGATTFLSLLQESRSQGPTQHEACYQSKQPV